jgi:hypothetical protein
VSRRDFDYYPTPPAAVRALGEWLESRRSPEALGGRWLDPCVGAGAIPLWLSPYIGTTRDLTGPDTLAGWDVMDIQPRMAEKSSALNCVRRVSTADGLTAKWRPMAVQSTDESLVMQERRESAYTGICMNPPYGADCEKWILKALQEARAGAALSHRPRPYVFALTRVNFWADGRRVRVLQPERLLWLEKRLSFTGDGKTDSSAHCWAMWNVEPRGPQTPGETVVQTVPLPLVSDEDVATHLEMLGHAKARQTALELTCSPRDVPSDDSNDIGQSVGL